MRLNYNTRWRQQRASETEDGKKGKIEKEKNDKDRERRAKWLLQKKRSRDEDGEVQDLAVLNESKELQNPMKTIIIL